MNLIITTYLIYLNVLGGNYIIMSKFEGEVNIIHSVGLCKY